jgi:hypothetical protein
MHPAIRFPENRVPAGAASHPRGANMRIAIAILVIVGVFLEPCWALTGSI